MLTGLLTKQAESSTGLLTKKAESSSGLLTKKAESSICLLTKKAVTVQIHSHKPDSNLITLNYEDIPQRASHIKNLSHTRTQSFHRVRPYPIP